MYSCNNIIMITNNNNLDLVNQFESIVIDSIIQYRDVNKQLPQGTNYHVSNVASIKPPKIYNYGDRKKKGGWNRNGKPKQNSLMKMKMNMSDDDKFASNVRGILNKLSVSNFESLTEQLIEMKFSKKEHLECVVNIIFQKAINENSFHKLYAQICKKLIGTNVIVDNNEYKFLHILITKCQHTFNASISVPKDGDKPSLFKLRDNVVGAIHLLGEFFNENILPKRIITECIDTILANIHKNTYLWNVDALCTLIKVTGDKLFIGDNKLSEKLFGKNGSILKLKNSLQMKEKFAIMDLIDLSKNSKWF